MPELGAGEAELVMAVVQNAIAEVGLTEVGEDGKMEKIFVEWGVMKNGWLRSFYAISRMSQCLDV